MIYGGPTLFVLHFRYLKLKLTTKHSFKTRLGHRLGRGTESLSRWSNHRVID